MEAVVNSPRNKPVLLADEVLNLRKSLEQKEQEIEQLLDYIQLLRQKRFGRSSEKISPDQCKLFDEGELEQLLAELDEQVAKEDTTEKDTLPAKANAQKKKPVRRPLPAGLKRVEKIIDVSDEEKATMGENWKLIGYAASEQLAVIQRQHYVVVTKRAKYAPVNESITGAEQGIKIAARPDQIIPKSIADASVIADVVTAKFVDGLPLYRQEKIYQRDGIDLSRQTMSGWIVQLEEKLSPLMRVMKKLLYEGHVLHIDETRLQVMNEPDKDNAQQSYMWVYKGGAPDNPVIWYQYAASRQGSVPVDFLYPDDKEHFAHSITLMTDGYAGYNQLRKMPGIGHHAGCWAHARRKFVEASKGRKNTAAAHQMVALIGKLYQIERDIKDKSAEEKALIRQEKATPIIEKIKTWLDSKKSKVLPKSLLGKATYYTHGLWPQLTVYIENGHVPIDNNAAENAIRPFVIGRKNWLFSGSPRGAKASAVLYSLIETARANELEPGAYLKRLFENLPRARSENALISLLPQNIKMSDLDR
ncbi:MAG: IS66 family transposase [Gammaproteobacteria bacterium]|nr:MAG: IS66 family transposase [Gammaproteobacteria bacterium]